MRFDYLINKPTKIMPSATKSATQEFLFKKHNNID